MAKPVRTASASLNTIFVSIPFDGRFDGVFDAISALASKRGLKAERIDYSSMLARPVMEQILRAIREARLVIADVTGSNPNVLHEVGLAQALGKPIVLITQEEPEYAAFNVRSLTVIRYNVTDLGRLTQKLDEALAETTSPNELLRTMLVPSTLGWPTRDARFVIVASPLSYRRVVGRAGGYTKLRRTYSDYVGVRGILQSFGLLFDFDVLPDMLDPEDYTDRVLEEPMNVYCIASPKANRWTGTILEEYSRRWNPRLTFRANPESKNLRNVSVSIFCDDEILRPSGWVLNDPDDRDKKDFGLIVRGPNPYNPELMTAVIAGRSSLGTEAACIAFTDPDSLENIQNRLMAVGVSLDDHRIPFWAMVSIRRDDRGEAIRNTLKIERVEIFTRA